MEKQTGIIIIFSICVLVLLIGMMKQKAKLLASFLGRMVAGGFAIYLTNQALLAAGSSLAVGMNPANLLTVGLLGIGGYGLLYGVVVYHSMA